MKKTMLAMAAAALAGCATVTVSSEYDRTMCAAENTCWKLLFCFPLGSGDPDSPNLSCCRFFRNTADVYGNMKMLEYAVKRKGAKGLRDVKSVFDDKNYLFILRRSACRSSAELIME